MGAAATTDLGLAAGFEPKLRIERVSSYRDFLDLEPEWTRIVQSSRVDHPFLEHAWLRTWWECFGEGSTLQPLFAKSANRVIGIAPLILTPIRMYGMHVRRLGFF